MKACGISLLVIWLGLAVPVCHAQKKTSQDVAIKALEGVIARVDPPKMTIAVRGADEKETSFVIHPLARIFRGARLIKFFELEKDDEVTVQYYVDDAGAPQVTCITVKNAIEEEEQGDISKPRGQ